MLFRFRLFILLIKSPFFASRPLQIRELAIPSLGCVLNGGTWKGKVFAVSNSFICANFVKRKTKINLLSFSRFDLHFFIFFFGVAFFFFLRLYQPTWSFSFHRVSLTGQGSDLLSPRDDDAADSRLHKTISRSSLKVRVTEKDWTSFEPTKNQLGATDEVQFCSIRFTL